jgi:outer membrane protein assembly factor BamB
LFLLLGVGLLSADTAWRQWGGPNGDFTCGSTGLAAAWPADGPAQVWSREIGEGHSTILYDEGMLYTMCRRGDKDAVLAVKADTGETAWEYQYDAPALPGMILDHGVGPHSTPLIVADWIFTIGGLVHFNCLDKRTGKPLWSRNLNEELGVSALLRGYGSSPIAYNDLVIVNVGAGRGAEDPSGLAAFDQKTGEVVWKSERLSAGYPTPILVNFNGQDMLIDCLGLSRFALDPATGRMLWNARVDRQSASIITSPLWIPPDKVFFSAGHGGGSRLFQLSVEADGTYAARQLWHYHKMRIMHGNAIRIDDHIYGSSGDLGPAYLMAVDLADGRLKWRQRGFAKATLLLADGKLVILDENGVLAIATATPEKLEVHAKAKVLARYAWTAPTLIGTRLYLRDYHTLKCLDLGAAANQ